MNYLARYCTRSIGRFKWLKQYVRRQEFDAWIVKLDLQNPTLLQLLDKCEVCWQFQQQKLSFSKHGWRWCFSLILSYLSSVDEGSVCYRPIANHSIKELLNGLGWKGPREITWSSPLLRQRHLHQLAQDPSSDGLDSNPILHRKIKWYKLQTTSHKLPRVKQSGMKSLLAETRG